MTRSTVLFALFPSFFLAGCPSDWDLVPDDTDVNGPGDSVDTDIELPDGSTPVAVCSVNQSEVQPPFETAVFDSSGSYDPAGNEITARMWTLSSSPAGNSENLSSLTGTTTSITPQLAGEYVVELVVMNNLGVRSEPATCSVNAMPSEDFWVEMYWSATGEDMDLHVLRPFGSKRTDDDCYFVNCDSWGYGLDWGVSGNAADDPALDLDDIPGTGPENINIASPESGNFIVFVHDYPGSVRNDTTDVTVNVYLGGSRVFSETRRISGEDSDTYFAKVNATAGTVVSCPNSGCP